MKYKVMTGFNYSKNGTDVRHEIGDIADGLPANVQADLLAQGVLMAEAPPDGDDASPIDSEPSKRKK